MDVSGMAHVCVPYPGNFSAIRTNLLANTLVKIFNFTLGRVMGLNLLIWFALFGVNCLLNAFRISSSPSIEYLCSLIKERMTACPSETLLSHRTKLNTDSTLTVFGLEMSLPNRFRRHYFGCIGRRHGFP